MKKGKIYEGIVTSLTFPNKAIVTVEGEDKVVHVKNAVVGQKVSVSVNKVRKDKAQGRILEVLEPAAHEVDPTCPHFGACGGCSYQNLSYEDQLSLKEGQVKELLDEVIREEYVWEGIKASPKQAEYRNKMEFSFGDEIKDGPLALGMHKRGSFHDIVSVVSCEIVDEDYRKILTATLEYFQSIGATYYHKMRHQGFLRHFLVRKGEKTGEILVDLVTSSQDELVKDEWMNVLLNLKLDGKIVGILHTLNDDLADAVKDGGTTVLYGQDFFYEELLGLRFKITPFSFFQTNSLGAEVLYETAREYIGETKDKVIFDLYSGTGTIAQILAPVAKRIVGVEIVEEAVEAAKINAQINGLENCFFHAGDVLKVIDDLNETPDLIVLDPPRDGIHPKALEKIINFDVDTMIYVSCKPTSLARDLVTLQARGYKVVKAVAVDQFPNTAHVESVALLVKDQRDEEK